MTLSEQMHAAGLGPEVDPAPGVKTHRFHVSGDKRGSKNGWYRYHGDHPVNATFGTYKQPGVVHQWRPAGGEGVHHAAHVPGCAPRPVADHRRVWDSAAPARDSHPYLVRKGVPAFGLRYHQGALLIPVRTLAGELRGLQRIWPDGTKRFTPGTEKAGHFFMIGKSDTGTIIICEGFATGATIHQATGRPVVVAFDAGNLQPVAEALRSAFPTVLLILAADDDHTVEGNPGRTMAIEAARAVSGMLAVPVFPGTRGPKDTDFNDLHQLAGLDAVRLQLSAVGEASCSE